MSIDLLTGILDKIEELQPEKAAKFFERPLQVIKKWQTGTAVPDVTAAQKILDEALEAGLLTIPNAAQQEEQPGFETPPVQGATRPEPMPQSDLDPKTTEGDHQPGEKITGLEPKKMMEKARRFNILTPTNRDFSYAVMLSIFGNWKAGLPAEIQEMLPKLDIENDTLIHRARNILATRFLASGNEWSFWMDSDVIAPTGNAGWFKRRANTRWSENWFAQSALTRLTSRGKTLVGGVYSERNTKGMLINQPGLSPKDDGDKKLVERIRERGPVDELVPVGWLGFGCVAVHRKVFEDILKTQPETNAPRDNEPHGFFTALEGGPQGEDVAFCKRALKAGHQSYLDLGLHCSHVGKFAFNP